MLSWAYTWRDVANQQDALFRVIHLLRNIVQKINAQQLALHSTNAIHIIPKDAAKLGVEAVTRT